MSQPVVWESRLQMASVSVAVHVRCHWERHVIDLHCPGDLLEPTLSSLHLLKKLNVWYLNFLWTAAVKMSLLLIGLVKSQQCTPN